MHDSKCCSVLQEKAAAEFAGKLGDIAKSNLEAEEEIQRKIRMKFLIQQKSLFMNGPVSGALSQLGEQDEGEQLMPPVKDGHNSPTGNATAKDSKDVEQEVIKVLPIDKDVQISPNENECSTRHTDKEQDVVKVLVTNNDVGISLSGNKDEEHNVVNVLPINNDMHVSPRENECITRETAQDVVEIFSTNNDIDISLCENTSGTRNTDEKHDIVEVYASNKDSHVSVSRNEEKCSTTKEDTVHGAEKLFCTTTSDQVGNGSLEASEIGDKSEECETISPSRNKSSTTGKELEVGEILSSDNDKQAARSGNAETIELKNGKGEYEAGKVPLLEKDDLIDSSDTSQMLARVMDEARNQVKLDEKAHIEALERNKAILEKVIEAQAQTEGKNVL